MAASWRVIVASSASVNSSRARCATQRTSSGVRAMRHPRCASEAGRHLEGPFLLRPLDLAAADALDADAQALHAAADLALDALQVGAEGAAADAGHLAADAAEVLGLAAAGV